MFAAKSFATTLSLALFVALGPLSTDMYLPALPSMAEELSANSGSIQLTLSLFLAGFALAQIIYGPISDRFGRKPVLIAGLVVFTLSSLACALSDNIYLLIIFRFLQALGGSAGPVIGRAMVRDIHGAEDSGRLLSQIATAMALAPAIAPIAGGFMSLYWGWSSIFLFLTLLGIFGTALLYFKIAESAPQEFRHPKSIQQILRDFQILLRDKNYLGFTLTCTLAYAGLFSFLSGSSFIIIEYYGIAQQWFGLLFVLVVIGFICGALIGGRLSRSHGFLKLVKWGSIVCMLSGLVMLCLAINNPVNVAATIGPMILFMLGVGIVMPQSMAGALSEYPYMAGSASGLLGFIQMTCAGLAGIVVGHGYDGTPLAMSLMIALMGCLTLASYVFMVHRKKA